MNTIYDFFLNYLNSVLDYHFLCITKADEEWLNKLLDEYIGYEYFEDIFDDISSISDNVKEMIKSDIDDKYD